MARRSKQQLRYIIRMWRNCSHFCVSRDNEYGDKFTVYQVKVQAGCCMCDTQPTEECVTKHGKIKVN